MNIVNTVNTVNTVSTVSTMNTVASLRATPRETKFFLECMQSASHSDRFQPAPHITGDLQAAMVLAVHEIDSCASELSCTTRAILEFLTPLHVRLSFTALSHIVAGKTCVFDNYKVVWSHEREHEFIDQNRSKGVMQYLFHGSPVQNWHGILHNGIHVMSNTKYMSTGAAHGAGIYLSNEITHSTMYATTTISSVIIGVYEIYDAARYNRAAKIYVVPDERELLLRYLLCVPAGTHLDNTVMSSMLGVRSAAREQALDAAARRRASRIASDMKLVHASTECTSVTTGENWLACTVLARAVRVTFPAAYPMVAPVVAVAGASTHTRDEWCVAGKLVVYIIAQVGTIE